MGGAKKTVKAVASDVVGATTMGVVDVNKNKLNLNPLKAAGNLAESVTGGDTIGSLMPEMPKPPGAEDPNEQAARARAEADKKVTEELGAKSRGLSGTVLGGSTAGDEVLKKKKLLGE